ncbi:MAG: DUF2958 domain-containing protein [Tissierellales bacterium]|nr:DUF2958 domain-containing protein [Tissierellales bacterium]
MQLLTAENKKILPALYSQDEVEDPLVILKYFTPDSSWTWLIIEGSEQEDGDWMFFCKASSHLCPEGELGYVMLSELEQVRGSLDLSVERDLYWKAKPLSKCK